MNQYYSEYIEYLGAIRDMLADIYRNTISQNAVLIEKDFSRLKKLLNERQAFIDAIVAMSNEKHRYSDVKSNEEVENMKRSIELLLKDTELMSTSNIEKAKKLKMELSEKILHINSGKKAITKGYFKRQCRNTEALLTKRLVNCQRRSFVKLKTTPDKGMAFKLNSAFCCTSTSFFK